MEPVAIKILIVIWGVLLGIFCGMIIRNRYEIRLHREALNKIIDELERIHAENKARELAGKITDLIFGEDRPEDLEKAIKEVADDEGFEVDSIIVKGKKKPAEKATKKAEKKEKK